MDNGVIFVLENFEKALLLSEMEEFKHLKGQIEFEYNLIKSMKKTGDAYEYFLKYADNSHENAEAFKVLDEVGLLSNEKISAYLLEHYSDEINNRMTMDDFVINESYTNSDLFIMFNDFMSGIRFNSKKNIVAVITSHNSLYGDTWDDNNILNYTGEGQKGDQKPTSSGNRALLSAVKNNTKIYLFEKVAVNRFYYRGEVFIDGSIKTVKEYDKDGQLRYVFKFPLKLINENVELKYNQEDQELISKKQHKEISSLSTDQLHVLAKNKKANTIKRVVEINYVERDPIISKATKNRANGKCDLCGENAPFVAKDGPYLESHHVITIADGGPDVIYNTVALCPNCHRKVHSLKSFDDFKALSNVLYKYLLDDNDIVNLEKWKELFNK